MSFEVHVFLTFPVPPALRLLQLPIWSPSNSLLSPFPSSPNNARFIPWTEAVTKITCLTVSSKAHPWGETLNFMNQKGHGLYGARPLSKWSSISSWKCFGVSVGSLKNPPTEIILPFFFSLSLCVLLSSQKVNPKNQFLLTGNPSSRRKEKQLLNLEQNGKVPPQVDLPLYDTDLLWHLCCCLGCCSFQWCLISPAYVHLVWAAVSLQSSSWGQAALIQGN